MKTLNRREFLRSVTLAAAGGVLAACAPQEVVKEVPVEKTVIVEKEVVRLRTPGAPEWDPPDLSGREYLMWGLQYDFHIETYERLAKIFEEYTGAKATIEAQPWPIEPAIITGMASGLVPDACCIHPKMFGELVRQGGVEPVDEAVFDAVGVDIDSWFYPASIQAFQFSGQSWGVPTETENVIGVTNVLYDLLAEHGAEDLWPPNNGEAGFDSFEEYYALAEALQAKDSSGNVTRWGLSTEGWHDIHLCGIMRNLGRDWWNPSTRTFHLDGPEALEAMYLLAYRPIFELGIEAHLGETSTESLLVGNVAVCSGNVTMPGSGRTMADPPVLIDSCVYPSAVSGTPALFTGHGSWGFIVPSQAKNKDIGLEFLKFVTTYEGQKEYCRMYGGFPSASILVNEDEELFPIGDQVGDSIRRIVPTMERTVHWGSDFGTPAEAGDILNAAVEQVRTGEAMPEDALAEAQATLYEMLARWDAIT